MKYVQLKIGDDKKEKFNSHEAELDFIDMWVYSDTEEHAKSELSDKIEELITELRELQNSLKPQNEEI